MEIEMLDLLGTKIKTLRIEKNMSQRELADKINISKNSISLYESGKKFPSLKNLCNLAHVLGASTDYLLGLTNDKDMYLYDLTEPQLDILRRTIHQFEEYNKLRNGDH